jgi:predicted PurR-regulated permease PerM
VLLFTIAGIIALLLNPGVTLLRRRRLPRGIAVLAVMLTVVCVVVVIGLLLANPVSDQVSAFQRNVPELVDDANATLADFQAWLDRNGIDVQVKEEGQTALSTIGERVSEGSGEIVSFTSDAFVKLVEASIALILIVVLTVYMLLYGERIGTAVRALVPRGDGTREDDYPTQIQAAVFGYVRGQLLFSLIMGTSAGVLLWVIGSLGVFPDGKTYALFFGAWYGFAELIPYVGPAIGAAPPVFIALFRRRTAGRGLADHRLHRAATDRGAHRRAGGVLAGAAHQPVAGDLRAAARRSALRDHRRVHRAAHRGHGALHGGVPAPSRPARALGPPGRSEPFGPEPPAADPRIEEPEGARCPECGAARQPEAAACPQCGTELGDADEEASAAASAPQ